ncbi:uncharacterized protein B0P05DRAFT_143904 [Gilbertella persicaria]|uniref:uncharacterized protein n=1 Tax=Gilbertella persicaria TaxID=101096 RepID=UPI00221FE016|nr:uncharacterized protein B0P05DRAFT_143904 [Gilbertella persicaria]KAI8075783.1 hypothetical protein B0P05DRAFT_143904 [Gilbertella persicaria]
MIHFFLLGQPFFVECTQIPILLTMPTEELENNKQLEDIELYVFLGGNTIKGKTANEIMEIMEKCSFVKPISVMKSQRVAGFCIPKFKNKQDAATFFHYYSKQKYPLCRSLYPLFVRPAKFKCRPVVQYSTLFPETIDTLFSCDLAHLILGSAQIKKYFGTSLLQVLAHFFLEKVEMNIQVYYENGRVDVVDKFGNEPIEMEVDEEQYPLDNVTNFDQYLDIKPP